MYPWQPEELLVHQATSLFRAPIRDTKEALSEFQDKHSRSVLNLPSTLLEKKVTCVGCKASHLARFKFCPDCGRKNEVPDEPAAIVMKTGRRAGAKRCRPSDFDISELVASHFAALKPATEAGEAALALQDGSLSSSSSSDSSSEDEPPQPPAALPPPAPTYDPPTVVPAQLRTEAGLRKAWTLVLADVVDNKHKSAFIYWLPGFLKKNVAGKAEHMKTYAKPGASFEEFNKGLIDHVVSKTPELRKAWYDKRVALMLGELVKSSSKKDTEGVDETATENTEKGDEKVSSKDKGKSGEKVSSKKDKGKSKEKADSKDKGKSVGESKASKKQ